MKKTKITLGLTALAAAFLLALGMPQDSNANTYWSGRSATAPYSPSGTQIDPEDDCNLQFPAEVCGYEFTDQNVYVGTIPGRRNP